LVNIAKADPKKRGIDHTWDFRGVDTKPHTHGFHTYPAMMIPQIADRLIDTYGKSAKYVFDPFVGSGTVLVESKLRKNVRTAIGVDLNPLALLISKVKTTPIKPSILLKIHSEILEKCSKDIQFPNKISVPNFNNIDFWFKPDVKIALATLKKQISRIKDEEIRNFFLVVFSETVRKVSNTRSGEFKLYRIAEEKLKNYKPNVLETFRKKSIENIEAMNSFYQKASSCDVQVMGTDSRDLKEIPDEEIDLIVTSPPYGDSRTTVAYGQFSRLALQWLGFDDELVRQMDKESLGGRPTSNLEHDLGSATLIETLERIRSKDELRARDVLSFYVDFNDCVTEIDRISKHGAFLCFVVGNRTVKEINIPTDLIIAELFQKMGYIHHQTIVRSIPSKRMPKKNSPTNERGKLVTTMNEEYIVILQKK